MVDIFDKFPSLLAQLKGPFNGSFQTNTGAFSGIRRVKSPTTIPKDTELELVLPIHCSVLLGFSVSSVQAQLILQMMEQAAER